MAASDERQVQPDVDDVERCQAIAVDTSEQCRHRAVAGTNYCAQHLDWADLDVTG